jgi:hypothetical protein
MKKVPLDEIEAIILDVAVLGVPNKDGKNEKMILGGKMVKMPEVVDDVS